MTPPNPSTSAGVPKKPVPPKCQVCGHSQCSAIRKEGFTDEQIAATGGLGAFDWLCGDCLYKRDHPDATPAVKMPNERKPLPLQDERLWDDAA